MFLELFYSHMKRNFMKDTSKQDFNGMINSELEKAIHNPNNICM